MNITITIPKNLARRTLNEYEVAKKDGHDLYFRVSTTPKRLEKGDKCFVIVRDKIIGYHIVKRFGFCAGFECEITGEFWDSGNFIVRNGTTWCRLKEPIKSKSHRNYRYVELDK